MIWLLLAACSKEAPLPEITVQGGIPPVQIQSSVIDESSALVASPTVPGLFWTLNDSGGQPQLYAITTAGRHVGTVDVEGVKNVDWEDLTVDDRGNIWIHDGGNNENRRQDLQVLRVSEPAVDAGSVQLNGRVGFRFVEQRSHPDRGALNFDSEALFWADERLYLLTKHRSDQDTVLYRFPALQGEVELERLGRFTLGGDPDNYGGMATAAELSPDGETLAVLSYHALFLFSRPEQGDAWLSGAVKRIDLDQSRTVQAEAVAWLGDELWIGNEGRLLFRLTSPFAEDCVRFPSSECQATVPPGGTPQ